MQNKKFTELAFQAQEKPYLWLFTQQRPSSAKALKEKLYLEYSRGSVPIFLRDVQNHQLVYYGIVFGKKKT